MRGCQPQLACKHNSGNINLISTVHARRLITCGTVEEKIYRKQVYKGGLFRTGTEEGIQTAYFSLQVPPHAHHMLSCSVTSWVLVQTSC